MFGSGGFPSLVLIDHEMKVHYKESGYYSTFVSEISEINETRKICEISEIREISENLQQP